MSKYLTRDEILARDDLPAEDVNVPEWGGAVRIRRMSGTERDAFEASIMGADGRQDLSNIRAKLVARSIVDEAGRRLFSDEDIAALGAKSAAALDRCFAVAKRLSRISGEDVEELAKN
jgi:hypothetical protein